MIQKIKNFIMVAMLPLTLAAPLALAPAVYAAGDGTLGSCDSIGQSINQGVNAAAEGGGGCETPDAGDGAPSSLRSVASKVVNLLSVLVGIVAVIMIIVGGFRYIASGGASDKVSGAKNTLIYAIVGLVIVALAQFIVHFVLTSVSA